MPTSRLDTWKARSDIFANFAQGTAALIAAAAAFIGAFAIDKAVDAYARADAPTANASPAAGFATGNVDSNSPRAIAPGASVKVTSDQASETK